MSDKGPVSENLTEHALEALNQAALAIGSDLELRKTLQHIVDSAATLVSARYAALGVFNDEGTLERFVYSGLPDEVAIEISECPTGEGLLGALLQTTEPIRIEQIDQDPRSAGFPAGHPPMASFLGVPIIAGETVLGNLYLTDKEGAKEFTSADAELMRIFAAHGAVAIKNAMLYEEVGRLAIVEERSRIGMDLHDGVIQSIYAVGLALETVGLLLEKDPGKARELLGVAVGSLNDAIRDIRNFILDLRPRQFEGDLADGLARLVREFQANAMVNVKMDADSNVAEGLDFTTSRAVFLTTQEALANVARHARASNVELTLEKAGETLHLRVSDDGKGFNPQQALQSVGHGLANMRARAEDLGGGFEIQSAPGEGTTIDLTLPLNA